jgi:FkbM family methyltransferase
MLRHLILYKKLRLNFGFLDAIFLVFFLKFKSEKIYLPQLKRTIHIRKKTTDRETFKEIFFYNIYNIKFPVNPKVIIDAGANVGFASLFFKLKFPHANIYSLEIEKNNFNLMHKNLDRFSNLNLINKGLFNVKSFFKIDNPYNASNSFIIKEVSENESYDVSSLAITDLQEKYNFNEIDVLKIDIEGAEKEVFEKNYEDWLPKVKVLFIETHDRMKAGCSFTIMKALSTYNFILYTTTEGGTLVYYNTDYIKL